MRGGDAVIRLLEQEGVQYISGFPGGGLPPLWAALRTSQQITAYSTRHERQGVEIDLVQAFRRAINATEDGQSALVEVMIKPLPMPRLAEDWGG